MVSQATRPLSARPAPTPAFFKRAGEGFAPTELALSPWSAKALSGAAVGALLAVLIDEAVDHAQLHVARLTIDILGEVPLQRLTGRVNHIRPGRRQDILAAELLIDDRVVARATALRLRAAASPVAMPRSAFPAPEQVAQQPFKVDRPLLRATRARPIRGGLHEPGPGTMWVAFDVQVVGGVPLSPLARATILGDFGSGVGSALHRSHWNFANVDITLHLLRCPEGEWVLVDSATESAGTGYALTRCLFADCHGIYGRGFQTLFVTPATPWASEPPPRAAPTGANQLHKPGGGTS